jgi:transposase InsO family protein
MTETVHHETHPPWRRAAGNSRRRHRGRLRSLVARYSQTRARSQDQAAHRRCGCPRHAVSLLHQRAHQTSQPGRRCAVEDVFSRRVVGWSIADHRRSDLGIDALQMATWRRRPVGTVVHADRGSQYTSWVFGHRLRDAGLLGSMGRVASNVEPCLYGYMLAFVDSQPEAPRRMGQHWRSAGVDSPAP